MVAAVAIAWTTVAIADVKEGVWEGHGECASGRQFYRVSIEPGEKRREARAVIDILDAPGGRAWARRIGGIMTRPSPTGRDGATHNLTPGAWVVRPLEEPPLPRALLIDNQRGTLSAAAPFGGCEGMQLQPVDPAIATGGVTDARDLTSRFAGRLSCKPTQPRYDVTLTIEGTADGLIAGTVAYRAATRTSGIDGRFAVLGELDAASGTLTLIADRWLGPGDRAGHTFDVVARLRDGGRRLIGLTSDRNCRTFDAIVPGHGPAAGIGLPATPRAISEWRDPSACVALIHWASQALSEAGLDSFYTGTTVGRARQVGFGLLDTERFTATFGTSFEELTEAERAHLVEVAEYCVRLTAFEAPMRHSGAHLFAREFFRFPKPDVATAAQRLRLLKARLVREMEDLRQRAVTADDIPDLERQMAELPERYADLWTNDRAGAQRLIADKLDLARGDLAARLEAEIAALPESRAAFAEGRALEQRFAGFGDDRERVETLSAILEDRLAGVADFLIGELVAEHRADRYDLAALERLSAAVDDLWPVVQAHARPQGAAMSSLLATAEDAAASAIEEFVAKTDTIMAGAKGFAARELAYRSVVGVYARHVSLAAPLAPAFAAYDAHLAALRPIPTIEDLVAADGSPTSLGMRLAVAEHARTVWATVDMLFPPLSLGRFYEGIRVAAVQKRGCKPEPDQSYWCDYDLRLDGSFPFLVLAELASGRARFAFTGSSWRVVEVPPAPALSSSSAGSVPRSGRYMDMTDPIQYWGANIMMDIR